MARRAAPRDRPGVHRGRDRAGQGRGAVHRGPAACAPAQPRRPDRKRARSLRPPGCCREKDQMRRTAMTACPNPTLHTVEGAPMQALANLLRAATEFDEIAGHLVDEDDLLALELERIAALRAAVHALNGTGGASGGDPRSEGGR